MRQFFTGCAPLATAVVLTISSQTASADWRVYANDQGDVTISSLDTQFATGLSVNCERAVTLVTQDTFAAGEAGLSGTYDNGLAFVVEARVPQGAPHTVELVRSDQRDALIRGLRNRHQLVLVDPNGGSRTFDLAGFGALWREACSAA